MLYFYVPQINKIHNIINPDHVYKDENDPSFGLETEPHCTLLYGFHQEIQSYDIKKVLKNHTFSTCKLHNVSLFENEKYDVLKYDVGYPTRSGEFLHKCNKELSKYPHTTNFPDYHPHLTIAYLKPGMGSKYVEVLKNQEFELTPQYAVYSHPNGSKTKIEIQIK